MNENERKKLQAQVRMDKAIAAEAAHTGMKKLAKQASKRADENAKKLRRG
jgi:hypothetical protein